MFESNFESNFGSSRWVQSVFCTMPILLVIINYGACNRIIFSFLFTPLCDFKFIVCYRYIGAIRPTFKNLNIFFMSPRRSDSNAFC